MNNRIIKFRFWNTIARRFQPDSMYSIMGNGKLLGYDYEVHSWDSEVEFDKSCIIAQQFTGYIDYTGKDVYEGDIVNLVNGDVQTIKYGRYLGNNGLAHCGFYMKSGDIIKGMDGTITIIGNIFENPDLLK